MSLWTVSVRQEGVVGAMIGVRISKALGYQDILGYDTIVYDQIGVFEDWRLRGGSQRYRWYCSNTSKAQGLLPLCLVPAI